MPVDRFAEIGPDRQSCEDLLCAVIALAIKDLEEIDDLEGKPRLTAYECQKLCVLTREWPPVDFLEGDWFEEICLLLNMEAETIRTAVRGRRDGDDGRPIRNERRRKARSQGVAVAASGQEVEASR